MRKCHNCGTRKYKFLVLGICEKCWGQDAEDEAERPAHQGQKTCQTCGHAWTVGAASLDALIDAVGSSSCPACALKRTDLRALGTFAAIQERVL